MINKTWSNWIFLGEIKSDHYGLLCWFWQYQNVIPSNFYFAFSHTTESGGDSNVKFFGFTLFLRVPAYLLNFVKHLETFPHPLKHEL